MSILVQLNPDGYSLMIHRMTSITYKDNLYQYIMLNKGLTNDGAMIKWVSLCLWDCRSPLAFEGYPVAMLWRSMYMDQHSVGPSSRLADKMSRSAVMEYTGYALEDREFFVYYPCSFNTSYMLENRR